MTFERFTPYAKLAHTLLPANDMSADGSHDVSHLIRVWNNAKIIQANEGGDLELLAAAVLLHDCVQVPKDSPNRSGASMLAAQRAREVLAKLGWNPSRIEVVAMAIESHSFSAGMAPTSQEGCILQDADRLDAMGLIGIARCFYTAGKMSSLLYDHADPGGAQRPLDDRQFALDHFPKKLLKLAEGFQTEAGQRLAQERHQSLTDFHRRFLSEIGA